MINDADARSAMSECWNLENQTPNGLSFLPNSPPITIYTSLRPTPFPFLILSMPKATKKKAPITANKPTVPSATGTSAHATRTLSKLPLPSFLHTTHCLYSLPFMFLNHPVLTPFRPYPLSSSTVPCAPQTGSPAPRRSRSTPRRSLCRYIVG